MMHLQLKLFSGEEFKHFVESDVFTLGRSSKCEVIAPFVGVSRQHLQIEVKNGEIFITDLGSTNGVFIDGEKVTPHVKLPYKTFLNLSFGQVQSLQIHLETLPQKSDEQTTLDRYSFNSLTRPSKEVKDKSSTIKTKKEQKRSALPKNAKEETISKTHKNIIFTNLLALMILGFAIAWYLFKEEEVQPPSQIPSTSTTEERPVQNYERF
jgi:pSer/pThr/pTyr-binding forkhead associated (FHA) protein